MKRGMPLIYWGTDKQWNKAVDIIEVIGGALLLFAALIATYALIFAAALWMGAV